MIFRCGLDPSKCEESETKRQESARTPLLPRFSLAKRSFGGFHRNVQSKPQPPDSWRRNSRTCPGTVRCQSSTATPTSVPELLSLRWDSFRFH